MDPAYARVFGGRSAAHSAAPGGPRMSVQPHWMAGTMAPSSAPPAPPAPPPAPASSSSSSSSSGELDLGSLIAKARLRQTTSVVAPPAAPVSFSQHRNDDRREDGRDAKREEERRSDHHRSSENRHHRHRDEREEKHGHRHHHDHHGHSDRDDDRHRSRRGDDDRDSSRHHDRHDRHDRRPGGHHHGHRDHRDRSRSSHDSRDDEGRGERGDSSKGVRFTSSNGAGTGAAADGAHSAFPALALASSRSSTSNSSERGEEEAERTAEGRGSGGGRWGAGTSNINMAIATSAASGATDGRSVHSTTSSSVGRKRKREDEEEERSDQEGSIASSSVSSSQHPEAAPASAAAVAKSKRYADDDDDDGDPVRVRGGDREVKPQPPKRRRADDEDKHKQEDDDRDDDANAVEPYPPAPEAEQGGSRGGEEQPSVVGPYPSALPSSHSYPEAEDAHEDDSSNATALAVTAPYPSHPQPVSSSSSSSSSSAGAGASLAASAPAPAPPHIPLWHGCRSIDCYHPLSKIDEGTYGVVFAAVDKGTGEKVAVKRVKMPKGEGSENEGFPITALREISVLLSLSQHPNIVRAKEMAVGNRLDKVYLVMEHLSFDVRFLMKTLPQTQPFTQAEVKCLMRQLLSGVAYMHSKWVLHRDLKTANLLMEGSTGRLAICDFGLARKYGYPLKQFTETVVTQWYRAPELLLGASKYGEEIDLWSVGCIFAEFITRKPLFPATSEAGQVEMVFKALGTPTEEKWPGFSSLPKARDIRMRHRDPPSLAGLRSMLGMGQPGYLGTPFISDKGMDLLNRLLCLDPRRRISAEEALNHSWFEESPLPCDPRLLPSLPDRVEAAGAGAGSSSSAVDGR